MPHSLLDCFRPSRAPRTASCGREQEGYTLRPRRSRSIPDHLRYYAHVRQARTTHHDARVAGGFQRVPQGSPNLSTSQRHLPHTDLGQNHRSKKPTLSRVSPRPNTRARGRSSRRPQRLKAPRQGMGKVFSFVSRRGRIEISRKTNDTIIATWPHLHVQTDGERSEHWAGGMVGCGDFIRGCKYVYENPKDPSTTVVLRSRLLLAPGRPHCSSEGRANPLRLIRIPNR